MHKLLLFTRYFCQILIKLELSPDFRKILKYQIFWKLFKWTRVIPCGRSDGQSWRS